MYSSTSFSFELRESSTTLAKLRSCAPITRKSVDLLTRSQPQISPARDSSDE